MSDFMTAASGSEMGLGTILLTMIILAGVIGVSIHFALKKPGSGTPQKPRRTFWLLLEMIFFALAIIFAFTLPWMRLSSPSSILDSFTSYSGKQYISLIPGLPELCDMLNLPIAVPSIVLLLISASIYVFIYYIVMCFARYEQKQPKGIVVLVMICISALLFEAYRLFLNVGMDSGDLGGVYRFTSTGTSLLVIALAGAAVICGWLNAKKRNPPLYSTARNAPAKYCTTCGKAIAESASFCEHCGAGVKRIEPMKNAGGNEIKDQKKSN